MRKTLGYLAFFLVLGSSASALGWPTFHGGYQRLGYTSEKSAYRLSDITLLWNFSTNGNVRSSPVMADINGDGLLEVVFGSDDRNVYALSNDGRLLWNYTTGGRVEGTPTAADIDGNNRTDVLVGSDDGSLYALDGRSGALKWKYTTGGMVRSSPAVGKLGDTFDINIVFGSYDGKIYCITAPGKKLWDYKTQDSIASSPALYDVDNDKKREVIIGSNDNMVYILKNPPYKVWSYLTSGDISTTPTVTGGPIFVGSEDKRLYRLEIADIGAVDTRRVETDEGWTTISIGATGLQSTANFTTNGIISSSAAFGQLNGTGSANLVFGSNDNNLYMIHDDMMNNITTLKRYTVSKPVQSSPALGRVGSDNATAIVFGSDDGKVYVITYPGITRFTYQTAGPVKSSPAIADLTNDGTLEFAIGSDDGNLYMFGDARTMNIQLGSSSYNVALKYRASGDIEAMKRQIQVARAMYLKANYTEGVRRCDDLVKTMEADSIFVDAKNLFLSGNLTGAEATLKEAAQRYFDANDTAGTAESQQLYKQIEAETYYGEAKYFFATGQTTNATIYLEAAIHFYQNTNDTAGLVKTEKLSKLYSTQGKSTTYFDDGMKALKDGKLDDAIPLLDFARQSYVLTGDNESAAKTAKLINTTRADIALKRAQEYFNSSEYDKAADYANRSMMLYGQVRNARVVDAQRIYNNSLELLAADSLYQKAQDSYAALNFTGAAQYSLQAMAIYNSTGDIEAYRRVSRLYLRSQTAQQPTLGGGILGSIKPTTIIVLLILAAAAWLMLKKPAEGPIPTQGSKKIVLDISGFKKRVGDFLSGTGKAPTKPKPKSELEAVPPKQQQKEEIKITTQITKEHIPIPEQSTLGLTHKITLDIKKGTTQASSEPPVNKDQTETSKSSSASEAKTGEGTITRLLEKIRHSGRKRPKVVLIPRDDEGK